MSRTLWPMRPSRAFISSTHILIELTLRPASAPTRVRIVVMCMPSMVGGRLLEARVERVAEAVAEEVEAEHGDEDGEAGEERQPGVGLDEGHVGLEVPSPARRRRLGAQA